MWERVSVCARACERESVCVLKLRRYKMRIIYSQLSDFLPFWNSFFPSKSLRILPFKIWAKLGNDAKARRNSWQINFTTYQKETFKLVYILSKSNFYRKSKHFIILPLFMLLHLSSVILCSFSTPFFSTHVLLLLFMDTFFIGSGSNPFLYSYTNYILTAVVVHETTIQPASHPNIYPEICINLSIWRCPWYCHQSIFENFFLSFSNFSALLWLPFL